MRIFDGSKQDGAADDGNNTSSGSESSSHSSHSHYDGNISNNSQISISSTASTGNKRKRTRKRENKTLFRRSKSENSSKFNKNVTTNNGGLTNHHPPLLVRNGFNTPPSVSTHLPLENNKNKSKTRKRISNKKYPPTPTPIFRNSNKNNNFNDKVSTIPSKEQRNKVTLDDLDLVDYEDLGASSSTSISSCSENENEKQDEKNHNFQEQSQPLYSSPKSASQILHPHSQQQQHWIKNSSKMDYNQFTGGSGNNNNVNIGVVDSMNNNNNINLEPCSSSSLRERLTSSQKSSSPSLPSTSKKASDLMKVNSEHETILIYDENNIEYDDDYGESQIKSVSHTPTLAVICDKYVQSGVGRHFGKKKVTSSTSSLMGGHDDGESLNGAGGGNTSGDGSGASEELMAYLMRFKAVAMVFLGTLLVLSISSLLFVFPIVVDPILLGLEASFSLQPVNCRTTNIRNGTGPADCSLPSCRAGCTADLFLCTFVDVEYTYYLDSITLSSSTLSPIIIPHDSNHTTIKNGKSESESSNDNPSLFLNNATTTSITKQGTLYININGCGYPPSVNCSEFYRQYGFRGSEFMCFYSSQNESIVVPYYNYDEEKHHLLLAIIIPLAIAAVSALSLFLLLKCFNSKSKTVIVNKSSSQLKLLDNKEDKISLSSAGGGGKSAKNVSKKWKQQQQRKDINDKDGSANKAMNGVVNHNHHVSTGPYMNGSVPKSNGNAFQNTISGLMGMVPPTEIQKSIKNLPHQHDGSFDKKESHNESFNEERKPRYAKKGKTSSPLFISTNKDKKNGPGAGKLAEHKL